MGSDNEEPVVEVKKPRKGSHATRMYRYFQLGMTETDQQLLVWLADYLGCSKAEANRTAIRAFAAQMRALQKDVGRPKGS